MTFLEFTNHLTRELYDHPVTGALAEVVSQAFCIPEQYVPAEETQLVIDGQPLSYLITGIGPNKAYDPTHRAMVRIRVPVATAPFGNKVIFDLSVDPQLRVKYVQEAHYIACESENDWFEPPDDPAERERLERLYDIEGSLTEEEHQMCMDTFERFVRKNVAPAKEDIL